MPTRSKVHQDIFASGVIAFDFEIQSDLLSNDVLNHLAFYLNQDNCILYIVCSIVVSISDLDTLHFSLSVLGNLAFNYSHRSDHYSHLSRRSNCLQGILSYPSWRTKTIRIMKRIG